MPYNDFISNEPMTTTFADYTASQEARENITLAVLGHTYALCAALRQNYIEYSIKSHQHSIDRGESVDYHRACIQDLKNGNCDYEFHPETGRKYHKIIMSANGSRSVHCFIDKKTGGVFKSASWRSPAKGERFNLLLIKDREWLLENASWSGSYLYKR
jgi:hypothetical protein